MEKNSIIYMVGQKIRIIDINTNQKRKAIISLLHDDNNTVDVIYDNYNINQLEEEISVEISRISSIEPFESVSMTGISMVDKKNYGNILYKLQDIDSSMNYYKSALDSLFVDRQISIGSNVLIKSIKNNKSDYNSGIISDKEKELYEVIYDDISLDEENGIDISRIVLVSTKNKKDTKKNTDDNKVNDNKVGSKNDNNNDNKNDDNKDSKNDKNSKYENKNDKSSNTNIENDNNMKNEERIELQRALYMNLARCYLMKIPAQPGWSLKYSSLAIGLSTSRIYTSDTSTSNNGNKINANNFHDNTDNNINDNIDSIDCNVDHNIDRKNYKNTIYNIINNKNDKSSRQINQINAININNVLQLLIDSVFKFLYIIFSIIKGNTSDSANSGNKDENIKSNSLSSNSSSSNSSQNNNDKNDYKNYNKNENNYDLNMSKFNKQLIDGYYLRCTALLKASRPVLAKKDAEILFQFDNKKGKEMLTNIENFINKRNKTNRKLARDVADWVDKAMQISSEKKTTNNQQIENNNTNNNYRNSKFDDDDIVIDNDDDDNMI